MRVFLLLAFTFAFFNLSFSQSGNGHTQTTTLSYNPTGFSASNMLQDAGTTTAAKSTINNNAAANAYANFEYDTTGKTVYVVYTTDNSTPNKNNGNQVTGSFNNYSNPNRTWLTVIPAQSAATTVKYVFYISDSNIASAWGKIDGNGYSTSWDDNSINAFSYVVKEANTQTGNWGTGSTWASGSAPTASSNVEIIQSTTVTVNSTSAASNDLTIVNNAAINITKDGGLTVNGEIANSGSVTINSDSNEFGSLIATSKSGIGTYTYEKYTASTATADLISAPFTDETFSDMITNNQNIYTNPSDNTQYLFGPFVNSSGSYQNYDSDTDGAETMSSAKGFRAATYNVASDLLISEYSEGSSNNKYIEIYNGTGSNVDLSNYEIWKIQNGGSWNEGTISLSGTLVSGDVYVVYHTSANTGISNSGDLVGSLAHNGNDAVGLAKSISGTMTLIDAVGTDGASPGSGWDVAGTSNATKDKTLVRKSTVCTPNTSWSSSAGTNTTDSEWTVYAQNTWDYIGSHTFEPNNPLSISGTFETSNQSINISIGADATNGKWNLIGNPFPTYLDLNHFYSDNSSNFDGTYSALYAYDGDESNGSNWTEYNNGNSSGNYIAPGQGFFVASKSGGGTITFDTDMQSVSGSDDFISGDIMDNTEVILRILNGDIVNGSTKIIFNENLSLALDIGWDAGSFSQSAAIMTRLVEDDEGHGLSINAMGLDAMENTVIPLVINQSAGQEFRINLFTATIPDPNVYLEDVEEGTFTNLYEGDFVYTPTSDLSGVGRFFIHMTADTMSNEEVSTSMLNAYKEIDASYITIEGLATQINETNVSLYNILGRKVLSTTLNNNMGTQTISTVGLSAGIYVIELESGTDRLTKKLLIQ